MMIEPPSDPQAAVAGGTQPVPDTMPPPGQTSARPEAFRPGLPLRRVGIFGVGSCVPDRVLSNEDLERMVATSDEWIVARTGMKERRIVAPGQATSDLSTVAAERALEQAGLAPEDVELILVATVTPDYQTPSTACLVQERIGARRAAAFDIAAACSGFVNALKTAHGLLAAGAYRNAVVIGAEVLSSITNYEDRESCILFGDAAGAMVLSAEDGGGEIIDHYVGVDGSGADLIIIPRGGSKEPVTPENIGEREHFLRVKGRPVFRFAVGKFCEIVEEIVRRNACTLDDVDLFVPHQANLRIIEAAASKLGIDMDRVLVNVDRYGNTSSASIPLAMDEAVREGRVKKGDLVCMAAFGGGLTWGVSLVRW